ncbi:Na+/H+ antiporter subunit E [Stutzerimonas tarimensis]|uniref:Na+/H+ antiporter subunit E n=1 Tax=Stutzerimonas tarimensis TaxID=1507735 RepID=A0ABV7T2T5_9GAMM
MGRTRLRRAVLDAGHWLVLYAVFWALFTEGQGWLFGIPCVLLASGLSLRLGLRPTRLKLIVLPGFLMFFIRSMVEGAWDVARRALHPQVPLAPAWVDYPLRCDSPSVRLLLPALVGLLPGTLVSEADGRVLRIHVLNLQQPWEPVVAELEQRLAALLRAGEAPR